MCTARAASLSCSEFSLAGQLPNKPDFHRAVTATTDFCYHPIPLG
jgi:hypothetical protein